MMKHAVSALVALLLTVSGCAYLKRATSAGEQQNRGGSKLKAPTNRVMLETYYGAESFAPPVPPAKIVGPYRFKTSWIPGEIRFEGVTVVEPFKETGRESKKNRGVRVDITSMNYAFEGKKGEQRRHMSYLDETEAHDFDTALSYFSTTASEWAKKKPDPRQELTYRARDSFVITLTFDEEGLMVFAWSGEAFSSGLRIPAASIGDVQAKLRAVLKALDGK